MLAIFVNHKLHVYLRSSFCELRSAGYFETRFFSNCSKTDLMLRVRNRTQVPDLLREFKRKFYIIN